MVNRQGKESTVGVCTYARCPSALGEQTDLCMTGTQRYKEKHMKETVAGLQCAKGHKGNHPSNYCTHYHIDESVRTKGSGEGELM